MAGGGESKLTWKKLTEKDCCEWKLMTVDPRKEHLEIRCEICYAFQLASYMDGDPLVKMNLHINKKSDYDI